MKIYIEKFQIFFFFDNFEKFQFSHCLSLNGCHFAISMIYFKIKVSQKHFFSLIYFYKPAEIYSSWDVKTEKVYMWCLCFIKYSHKLWDACNIWKSFFFYRIIWCFLCEMCLPFLVVFKRFNSSCALIVYRIQFQWQCFFVGRIWSFLRKK